MVSLPQKNCNVFRASYEKRFAHVDDISHAFGVASYQKFYFELHGWKEFIDALFPDWFPLNVVQGVLMSVIDYLHDNRSEHCYNVGVDQGLRIVGKVNEVVNWAQNQITTNVEQAKSYVKTNFIDPLEAKANQIKSDLQNAQTKLSSMGISIDGFKTDVNTMKGNITSFANTLTSYDGKLTIFDTKIKDLTSQASAITTRIKDAETNLNSMVSKVNGLNDSVNTMKGNITSFANTLKTYDGKLANLDSRIATFDTRINDLNSQASAITTRIKDAEAKLNSYKTLLDDLDRRVKSLEAKPKEIFPSLPPIFKF